MRRGDVFASDHRGGIARVHEGGPPELILGRGVEGFLPNGFALLPDRSFMIANLGPSGGVYRMFPDGELLPELLEVDGVPLPPTNFAHAEHTTGALRLWVSVSTCQIPREQAMRSDVADGFAFDAEGGIWIGSVVSNRLLRIAPGGGQTVELDDGDPEAIARAEHNFASHSFTRADIDAGRGGVLGNLASVTFGGPGLKTVFLGSLFAPRIATFRSPIAGAPPPH